MPDKAKRAAGSKHCKGPASFVSAWFLVGVLLAGQGAAGAQTSLQRTLSTPIKEFTFADRPVVDGLLDLAYVYRFPLAVECVDSDLVRRAVSLRFMNRTVRAAIRGLVGQLPGYRVDFSRGLVDVYCPRTRSDASNILNITVGHFEVAGVDATEASARLQGELFAKLHPGMAFGGQIVHGETSPAEPRVTLRLEDRKVYEILNAIVTKDGAAMWLVVVPPAELGNFSWNEWAVYNLNPAGHELIIDFLRRTFP